MYATFINNPWSATFGDNSGFSNDDWDGDGIPNSTDPYPIDSTNSGDTTAPVALSYTPNHLSVSQLPDQDIVVSFDERINLVSARFGVFLDDGSNLAPLFLKAVDASGSILTYTFPYFLRSDTVYTLRLHGIMDMMGNTVLPNSGIGTFRTLDSTLPIIVGITPSTNTVISTAPSTMSISFDEPMDPSSFGALTISGAGTPSLSFLGLTSGNSVANYTVSGLEESSTYHLNFWTSGIQDANGNPLTLTWETYSFRTVDTTPPIAISIGTPTNAVGLATNSFQIFFNEEINPASLPNSVYLDRNNHMGTLLTSETLNFVGLDASKKIATFTRSLPGTLVQNGYYAIRLEPGIADTSNNVTVTPRMFNFKTVDTVNPSITNYTLAGPTPTQFVDGIHFTIQFSEEMDRNTLTNAINAQIRVTNLNLPVQLQSYDPLTFVASYWIPSSAFLDGQNYATIYYGRTLDIFRNNAAPPRDLSGRAVAAFTYPVSLTNDPPAIQPLIGFLRRTDISDTTAVLTMNRSMDATTLPTVSFSLGYRYRSYYPSSCGSNEIVYYVSEPIYRSHFDALACETACRWQGGIQALLGQQSCDPNQCWAPIGYQSVPRTRPGCRYSVSPSILFRSRNYSYSGVYNGFNFIDSNESQATFNILGGGLASLRNDITNDNSFCMNYGNPSIDCQVRPFLLSNNPEIGNFNSGTAQDFNNIPMTFGAITP